MPFLPTPRRRYAPELWMRWVLYHFQAGDAWGLGSVYVTLSRELSEQIGANCPINRPSLCQS